MYQKRLTIFLCIFTLFLGVIAQAEGTTIHALLLIMNADKTIGKSCDIDRDTVSAFIQSLQKYVEVDVNMEIIESSQKWVTFESAQKWLDGINPDPDDVIFVYYTGHGGMKDGKTFLCFEKANVWRSALVNAIKAKQGRLKILMTDCCSSLCPYADVGAPSGRAHIAEEDNYRVRLMKNLFLRSSGFVDMTAATEGEFAIGDTKVGGWFTDSFFCEAIGNLEAENVEHTWEMVFNLAKERTEQKFQRSYPDGCEGSSTRQYTQTPKSYSMPGMEVDAKTISLYNDGEVAAYYAVHYTQSGVEITEGWWKIEPAATVLTAAVTTSSNIYVYVEGVDGRKSEGSYYFPVNNSGFKHIQGTYLQDSYEAAFFKVEIGKSDIEGNNYTLRAGIREAKTEGNTISIYNDGDVAAYYAIHYTQDGVGVTQGWWKVEPGATVVTTAVTRDSYVYLYLEGVDARKSQGYYNFFVNNNAFRHVEGASLDDSYEVGFFSVELKDIQNGNATIKAGLTEQTTIKNAEFQELRLEHNVYENKQLGMRIYVTCSVVGMKDKDGLIVCYFYLDSGEALKDYNQSYCSTDGSVSVSQAICPGYENTLYSELAIFMPYEELHLSPGTYNLKCYASMWFGESGHLASSNWADFSYGSEPQPTLNYYETRYLKVSNESSYNLQVHIDYYTNGKTGDWQWFNAMWNFAPGEASLISHEGFTVHARFIYIWAETKGLIWDKYKNMMLDMGEPYYATEMETHTHSFSD